MDITCEDMFSTLKLTHTFWQNNFFSTPIHTQTAERGTYNLIIFLEI